MKDLWGEFKAFIMRGNVLDLAVAVVIGTAFKAVVDALVSDIVQPIIGIIVGKPSFDALVLKVGKGRITYGHFIGQVVNFLIIAAAIFVMIKSFEKMQNLRKRGGDVVDDTPAPSDEAVLLTEIRDLLAQSQAR